MMPMIWLDLLRHACGMDGRDPFYRDYFAADPGGNDDREWSEMVSSGLAEVRREPSEWSPLRIYGVTDKGKNVIGSEHQTPLFKAQSTEGK